MSVCATGCRKPNTGAQVVQRGGEWPIMTVTQSVPSVIPNSASLLSGSCRIEPHYHLQIRVGILVGKKKKNLPKFTLNFILYLSSNYKGDFIQHLKMKTRFKASFNRRWRGFCFFFINFFFCFVFFKSLGCDHVVCVCVLLSCQEANCCGCNRLRSFEKNRSIEWTQLCR